MDTATTTLIANRGEQAAAVITGADHQYSVLVKPRILGAVFQAFDYPTAPEHLGSVTLDGAHDAYVGSRCGILLPQLLDIHARAVAAAGAILTWDADRLLAFIHELPERSIAPVLDDTLDVPGHAADERWPVERKAYVMVEQSIRYLVVLVKQFGSWTLHVRQWFPDVAFDAGLREHLDEVTADIIAQHAGQGDDKKGALSVELARACAAVLRDVADEREFAPANLGLTALVRGGWAMDRLARISITGLRYGDDRDPGYILSYDSYGAEVKDALHHFVDIRVFFNYATSEHRFATPSLEAV